MTLYTSAKEWVRLTTKSDQAVFIKGLSIERFTTSRLNIDLLEGLTIPYMDRKIIRAWNIRIIGANILLVWSLIENRFKDTSATRDGFAHLLGCKDWIEFINILNNDSVYQIDGAYLVLE